MKQMIIMRHLRSSIISGVVPSYIEYCNERILASTTTTGSVGDYKLTYFRCLYCLVVFGWANKYIYISLQQG